MGWIIPLLRGLVFVMVMGFEVTEAASKRRGVARLGPPRSRLEKPDRHPE
jgi:hypothetical protein